MTVRWSDIRQLNPLTFLEAGTLVSILVVAGGILLFAELMEVVGESPLVFDRAVLLGLRNPADLSDPIGPVWVESAFRDMTSLGGGTLLTLMTAAVIGFLLIDGKRAAAALVFASVTGGALLTMLLKLLIARPRPDLVPHLVEVQSASFPSGHAMLSAVVYLTLGALLARVEGPVRIKVYVLGVAIFFTLVVGLSRVYLGVHWPTDVLAGWCAGAAWATVCWRIALALQRRGEVEIDAEGRVDQT